MDNVTKVPVSKFRRELRKWLRYIEENDMIIVTQRNGPDVVCMREGLLQDLVDKCAELV